MSKRALKRCPSRARRAACACSPLRHAERAVVASESSSRRSAKALLGLPGDVREHRGECYRLREPRGACRPPPSRAPASAGTSTGAEWPRRRPNRINVRTCSRSTRRGSRVEPTSGRCPRTRAQRDARWLPRGVRDDVRLGRTRRRGHLPRVGRTRTKGSARGRGTRIRTPTRGGAGRRNGYSRSATKDLFQIGVQRDVAEGRLVANRPGRRPSADRKTPERASSWATVASHGRRANQPRVVQPACASTRIIIPRPCDGRASAAATLLPG